MKCMLYIFKIKFFVPTAPPPTLDPPSSLTHAKISGKKSAFNLSLKGNNIICVFIVVSVFPNLSTLELKNTKNGPRFRILREISALEPAPKVVKLLKRKLLTR